MAGVDSDLVKILIAQARAAAAAAASSPTVPSVAGALGQVTPNIAGNPTVPSTIDLAAQQWLQALITTLSTDIFAHGDQYMTSTSMNGKSIMFNTNREITKVGVMKSAQRALEWLASGYQGPTSEIYGRAF